jgi:copper resistance protein B
MKQTITWQIVLFILFGGSSLALAQVQDTRSHQDHAEQSSVETTHEHNVDPAEESAAIDHAGHGAGASVSPPASDHDQHNSQTDTDASEHQHMPEAMGHDAMSDSMMQSEGAGSLRDPHAYSNGFELTSGPYLLESRSKIGLADEINFTGLWVDRFEYVESHDLDATEFEGHAWIGDSYNRFLLRSEIEVVNDSIETAELDLLHTRAISPFWNVQFGLRREFGEEDERNWASIGLSGLAPYWFEVDASVFLGENGNTLLDIEAEYDLLLTQRLVMQPRIDIHSYGKTDKEMGRGSGLSTLKTGFRLRYEFDRQLAPYLGYERVIKYGETADLLPAGEDRTDNHWIIGFKFWF